jgi:hypothetical protein
MSHKVNHRGAAPEDEQLFTPEAIQQMRCAIDDLCWLLNRGYAIHSAIELVGNRFTLRERQRLVVGRCAATDEAIAWRRAHCLAPKHWRGQEFWLDGYNVLIVVEAALGGGVVLLGRDDCCRDLLGIHGSYHRVHETATALQLIGEMLRDHGVTACRWLLDKPVSNSGRLRAIILDAAAKAGWNWEVSLEMNPDNVLAKSDAVVGTSDSVILDRCERWANVARAVIANRIPNARVVDLAKGEAG